MDQPIVIGGFEAVSLNRREHWGTKARRVKREREAVATALRRHHRPAAPPASVQLVLVRPRRLDSDNAVAACKAARDAVASWLGIDDGDPRTAWHYAQRHGAQHALEIAIGGVS